MFLSLPMTSFLNASHFSITDSHTLYSMWFMYMSLHSHSVLLKCITFTFESFLFCFFLVFCWHVVVMNFLVNLMWFFSLMSTTPNTGFEGIFTWANEILLLSFLYIQMNGHCFNESHLNKCWLSHYYNSDLCAAIDLNIILTV